MNKLSPGLQNVLLNRSLFDILCDIWFIPMITLYIKALVSPILYDMSPEDAWKMIENDIPHQRASEAILRKGLINLFPTKLKDLLMNNYEERLQ